MIIFQQRPNLIKALCGNRRRLILPVLLLLVFGPGENYGWSATWVGGCAGCDDGKSSRGSGSYSSPSSSSRPGYSMPPAAAEALERARQYQNMGDAVNRGLDRLRESYERQREQDEERARLREEREERERRREEELQERLDRQRERDSYRAAPARSYNTPAYQAPSAPAYSPPAPVYSAPPPPPAEPTPAERASDIFGTANQYRGSEASENSSSDWSNRLSEFSESFRRGYESARNAARPYVEETWERLMVSGGMETVREYAGQGGNVMGSAANALSETAQRAASGAWRNLISETLENRFLRDDLTADQRNAAQTDLRWDRDAESTIRFQNPVRPRILEIFETYVGEPLRNFWGPQPADGEGK